MASPTWKLLSGENNWAGLLDPLNDYLRSYIIRYGERVQAIADAFNNDVVSHACNFSRYPRKNFFSYVGLEKGHPYKYDVTRFIYAPNNINNHETTWIGYVAVTRDESVQELGRRDILVSWRGTVWQKEVNAYIVDEQVDASDIFPKHSEIKIHGGWHGLYTDVNILDEHTRTSAGSQVLAEIKSLIQTYSKEKEISITVAGHGMGGALATLNGADIVFNWKKNFPLTNPSSVTVFAFSSPKVGNDSFQKVDDLENLHILRIENVLDIVPRLPPFTYYPVGNTFQVDSRDSSDLKNVQDGTTLADVVEAAHQLEVLLHLVAGTNGIGQPSNLNNRRQVALVNKDGDYLKEDVAKANEAPASWWVEKNKGFVQESDGSWVLDLELPPT